MTIDQNGTTSYNATLPNTYENLENSILNTITVCCTEANKRTECSSTDKNTIVNSMTPMKGLGSNANNLNIMAMSNTMGNTVNNASYNYYSNNTYMNTHTNTNSNINSIRQSYNMYKKNPVMQKSARSTSQNFRKVKTKSPIKKPENKSTLFQPYVFEYMKTSKEKNSGYASGIINPLTMSHKNKSHKSSKTSPKIYAYKKYVPLNLKLMNKIPSSIQHSISNLKDIHRDIHKDGVRDNYKDGVRDNYKNGGFKIIKKQHDIKEVKELSTNSIKTIKSIKSIKSINVGLNKSNEFVKNELTLANSKILNTTMSNKNIIDKNAFSLDTEIVLTEGNELKTEECLTSESLMNNFMTNDRNNENSSNNLIDQNDDRNERNCSNDIKQVIYLQTEPSTLSKRSTLRTNPNPNPYPQKNYQSNNEYTSTLSSTYKNIFKPVYSTPKSGSYFSGGRLKRKIASSILPKEIVSSCSQVNNFNGGGNYNSNNSNHITYSSNNYKSNKTSSSKINYTPANGKDNKKMNMKITVNSKKGNINIINSSNNTPNNPSSSNSYIQGIRNSSCNKLSLSSNLTLINTSTYKLDKEQVLKSYRKHLKNNEIKEARIVQ